MNKRVALIFSGLPRIYEKSIRFWDPIVSKYNPEIFFHTWDLNQNYNLLTRFIDIFQPKALRFDKPQTFDYEKYQSRSISGINVYNIFSSWESVKRGYKLFEQSHSIEPDIIIRARFDIHSEIKFEIMDSPEFIIPMFPNHHPACFHYKNQFVVTQQDSICYGIPFYVKKYCHLIDDIHALLNEDDTMPMLSEHVLAAHLYKQEVSFYNQSLLFTLVRE